MQEEVQGDERPPDGARGVPQYHPLFMKGRRWRPERVYPNSYDHRTEEDEASVLLLPTSSPLPQVALPQRWP